MLNHAFRGAAALCLAASLSGCGAVQSIESNLASPTTTQAAANVKVFVTAFACGLSAAAAAAQGVIGQTYNGKTIVDANGQAITAIVYASSTAACTLLGGVVTSATPVAVPVSAVAK